MNISNITPPQVWTSSSRSLTNIGSSALTTSNTLATAIAANTSVDLRPSAGIVGWFTVGVTTGTSPTSPIAINQWDGTTAEPLVKTTAATNVSAAFLATGTNAVGVRVTNQDAAVAGTYSVSAFVLTI